MCEYCDGSKKPIAEIDSEAYMTLTPYASEIMLDVYSEPNGGGIWYSFIVPCCPMCGRKLSCDVE